MAMKNTQKQKRPSLGVTVVKDMRDYSKEPVFVKKKEAMIALLEKYGLPDGSKFKRQD